MKTELYIELNDTRTSYGHLMDMIKDAWKAEGNLMKDLKNVELYVKIEERKCYYVINGDAKGYLEI